MTAHLPPQLLALFTPRPPIPYVPPMEKEEMPPYTGIANFVSMFEQPTPEQAQQVGYPFDNKKERKKRRIAEKLKKHQEELEEFVKSWDPSANPNATNDPYKTLFVGRLNFDTSEHKLKREFETYGQVKKARLIQDKEGKPRGYGFVEFEKERDMRNAYKLADGRKIDGRRVVVDVERGRTVRNWRPRRLGGGIGSTRAGGEDVNQKFSGREPPTSTRGERGPSRDEGRPRSRERERRDDRGSRDKDKERDGKDRESRDKDKEREREKPRHRERSRERSPRERERRKDDKPKDRERERRH